VTKSAEAAAASVPFSFTSKKALWETFVSTSSLFPDMPVTEEKKEDSALHVLRYDIRKRS